MKYRLSSALLLLLVCSMVQADVAEDCEEEKEDNMDCTETEYKSYVECIRKRIKRSTDCSYRQLTSSCTDTNDCTSNTDTCGDCNCEYCSYNACHNPCTSCCTKYDNCQDVRCCHKTCHAQCKSSTCRTSCKRDCYESIQSGNSSSSLKSTNTQNITTIINLHNVINNTNLIDIPVNVTNVNNNNFTLDSESSSAFSGSRLTENCCNVVSPRQCVPTDKFPFMRCFHYRKKSCGPFCTSPIVHEQPHEVCDENPNGQPNCHQQVIYIPQPQPRCYSQSTWPYINCAIGQQTSCDGCYDHFINGGSAPSNCPGECYDGSFSGPNFGQGINRPNAQPSANPFPWGSVYGQTGVGTNNGFNQNPIYPFQWQGLGIPSPNELNSNFFVETDPKKDKGEETEKDGEAESKRSSDKKIVEEKPPIPYSLFGFNLPGVTRKPEKVPKDISIGVTVVPKEAPNQYAVIAIDSKNEDVKKDDDTNEKNE